MKPNSIVVLFLACVLSVADCADKPTDTVVVRSAPLSLGHGDFRLSGSKTDDLSMSLSRIEKPQSWRVKPHWSADKEKPDLDVLTQPVKSIVLARQSGGLIIAVIKTIDGGKSYFWGMTFTRMDEIAGTTQEFRPFAELLHIGDPKERILAVSADIDSPTITLVTAKFSEINGNGNQIEAGTITIERCGMLEYGETGTFIPKYKERGLQADK